MLKPLHSIIFAILCVLLTLFAPQSALGSAGASPWENAPRDFSSVQIEEPEEIQLDEVIVHQVIVIIEVRTELGVTYYAYCHNDPINCVDYLGLEAIKFTYTDDVLSQHFGENSINLIKGNKGIRQVKLNSSDIIYEVFAKEFVGSTQNKKIRGNLGQRELEFVGEVQSWRVPFSFYESPEFQYVSANVYSSNLTITFGKASNGKQLATLGGTREDLLGSLYIIPHYEFYEDTIARYYTVTDTLEEANQAISKTIQLRAFQRNAGMANNIISLIGPSGASKQTFGIRQTASKPPLSLARPKPSLLARVKNLITFKSSADVHLRYRDYNVPQKRGIGGAHNRVEFMKASDEINIVSETPHPNQSGLSEIDYQMPILNKVGERVGGFRSKVLTKTIYDPAVIPDHVINLWARQAAMQAKSSGGISGRQWFGVAPNGVKFTGFFDDSGQISTYHPTF